MKAAAAHAPRAWAVDNLSSKDAPDLTSVRAKIKAKDYKGAIAELTPMLVTNQHADVYNLMGFSLRKTGDYKQFLHCTPEIISYYSRRRGRRARTPDDTGGSSAISVSASCSDGRLAAASASRSRSPSRIAASA